MACVAGPRVVNSCIPEACLLLSKDRLGSLVFQQTRCSSVDVEEQEIKMRWNGVPAWRKSLPILPSFLEEGRQGISSSADRPSDRRATAMLLADHVWSRARHDCWWLTPSYMKRQDQDCLTLWPAGPVTNGVDAAPFQPSPGFNFVNSTMTIDRPPPKGRRLQPYLDSGSITSENECRRRRVREQRPRRPSDVNRFVCCS